MDSIMYTSINSVIHYHENIVALVYACLKISKNVYSGEKLRQTVTFGQSICDVERYSLATYSCLLIHLVNIRCIWFNHFKSSLSHVIIAGYKRLICYVDCYLSDIKFDQHVNCSLLHANWIEKRTYLPAYFYVVEQYVNPQSSTNTII